MYLAYIIKCRGAKFTKHGGTFAREYKKYIRIMIEIHPAYRRYINYYRSLLKAVKA